MEWDGRNGLYKHMVNTERQISIIYPRERERERERIIVINSNYLGNRSRHGRRRNGRWVFRGK